MRGPAYDREMPSVADIATAVADRTRPDTAAVWDPVGLQLGDPEAEVASIAVCHEVTEQVVARLEGSPVDLLVTYHPLLFEPVNRVLAGRTPSARAFRLLRAKVNLLVTHTDFDAAPGGAADALAGALRLRDPVPFGEDEIEGRPAIGRVGRFDGTLAALDAIVSDVMGHAGLRISGDRDARVERVAVVPGSGSDLIALAAKVADALVTGDVAHHKAVRALDLGLMIIDPGHIGTERPGMRALVRMVEEVTGMPVVDLTEPSPATWS